MKVSRAHEEHFRGIAVGDTVESARACVDELDRLYREFTRASDRGGQHEVWVFAINARNRCRWRRRPEMARVFMDWLVTHSDVEVHRA